MSLFDKQPEGTDIKINDTGIVYKDFESYAETKWSCYTHYKFYDDYLLIGRDEYYAWLLINKNEISNAGLLN